MLNYSSSDINRFWAKVGFTANPDKCWEWQARCYPNGYGQFFARINKIRYTLKGHRMAWELTNGEITNGLFVLHSCDNRKCCNPKHLFLGTHLDNMRDKVAKGRQYKQPGELHSQHKLTERDVKEIRDLYASGVANQVALSKTFGVRQSTISYIIRRAIWSHIK